MDGVGSSESLQYPVCLNLAGTRCLVVGGGPVAERKIEGLLPCGGRIVVVSPRVTAAIRTWALEEGRLEWRPRVFRRGDTTGAFLVIAATGRWDIDETVAREAARHGVLVNVVDGPGLCRFTVPSVLRRGSLCVAVSTNGKSPTLARLVRQQLEGVLGEDNVGLHEVVAQVRTRLRATVPDPAERRAILERLLAGDLPRLVREGDEAKVQEYVRECVERCTSLSSD